MKFFRRLITQSNPRPTRRELCALADAARADFADAMPTGSCSPLAIVNRAAHLRLNDAITKHSVDRLIAELDKLNGEPLTVEISASEGLGDQALRAFQALRAVAKKTSLTTIASGDISGPGVVAFLAGDNRIAQPGSNLAITPPLGFAQGPAKNHAAAAKALESIETATVACIVSRAKMPRAAVVARMQDGNPIDPSEAVKIGLATSTAPTAQAREVSPAIIGATIGFRPPPLPTNQQTDKPTMTAKPPATETGKTGHPHHDAMDDMPAASRGAYYKANRTAIRAEMAIMQEQARLEAKLRPSIVVSSKSKN